MLVHVAEQQPLSKIHNSFIPGVCETMINVMFSDVTFQNTEHTNFRVWSTNW